MLTKGGSSSGRDWRRFEGAGKVSFGFEAGEDARVSKHQMMRWHLANKWEDREGGQESSQPNVAGKVKDDWRDTVRRGTKAFVLLSGTRTQDITGDRVANRSSKKPDSMQSLVREDLVNGVVHDVLPNGS
jgi:hypothetical protein